MTVIRVEHLSKEYRLGMIGGTTLREDLSRWWALKRGKDDPLAKVGTGAGQTGRIGERFWALRDVSFEVKQGEILGIIGRNGAGKSTLLKILSRITAPTEGVVKVKGRIGSLLEVGTGFHPELTGRENIYLNGAILGMNRREVTKKLDEIIAFSEVEQFIDTPVKRYSSGMYVRLAFAVAAHLDPEILIVDEVLAVGDAAFQKKCLGKMGDVSREGRTVLFVSHNMQAVASLCPLAALVDKGHIVTMAEAQSAIRAYYEHLSDGHPRAEQDRWSCVALDADHTKDATLVSVRITSPDGVLLKSGVPVSGAFCVEIIYEIRETRPDMYVTCGFVELDGGLVWWRYDADTDATRDRQPGRYRAILLVPDGFLRAATYGLSVSIVDPSRPIAVDYRGVVLKVNIGERDSVLGRRGKRWPSPIRYEPGWTTTRL